MQANPSDFSEGDCRYIAPETLESNFTKAADIFSLGITILEVASKVELPRNGFIWQQLRNGVLPEHYLPREYFQIPSYNDNFQFLLFYCRCFIRAAQNN